ncbi:MAG: Thioredoxin, partial [uncultured Phycisphaerae bacterium]
RRAGARRFLGRMVRPVPDARPDDREDRQRLHRQGEGRQARHRREPRHQHQVQHQRDPDRHPVQGRPGRPEVRRDAPGEGLQGSAGPV